MRLRRQAGHPRSHTLSFDLNDADSSPGRCSETLTIICLSSDLTQTCQHVELASAHRTCRVCPVWFAMDSTRSRTL